MFNLSLPQRLTEWVLPTSPEPPSIPVGDNNTGIGVFAPELLDQIIDHLHNDKPTLLCLGLTSRQTLIKSRLYLFSQLEFKKDDDRQFDTFLTLLEAPWTSFTNAVESLHVKELFHPRGYKHLPNKNLSRILANLPNLKTLRLTSLIWPYIPPHIHDFFLQTNIVNLHLDSVEFTTYRPEKIDIVELFTRLQPSIKSIALYELRFDDEPIPNLSQYSSTFRRRIHLTTLDTCSLLLFKDVWDPLRANDLDITVESFHVRLAPLTRSDRAAYTPFFSRFLRQVGPSLQHIFIKLSDPYLDMHALPYYPAVDLSQCVNVRIVHVGTIDLDLIEGGERTLPTMATMWNSLSTLPSQSPSLEQVVFVFRPFTPPPEGKVAELERFAWLHLVEKVQEMFPNVKTVTVGVGYYVADNEDLAPYLAALRRTPGLQQLEENGTVSLQMIPWETYGLPDPAWSL